MYVKNKFQSHYIDLSIKQHALEMPLEVFGKFQRI